MAILRRGSGNDAMAASASAAVLLAQGRDPDSVAGALRNSYPGLSQEERDDALTRALGGQLSAQKQHRTGNAKILADKNIQQEPGLPDNYRYTFAVRYRNRRSTVEQTRIVYIDSAHSLSRNQQDTAAMSAASADLSSSYGGPTSRTGPLLSSISVDVIDIRRRE